MILFFLFCSWVAVCLLTLWAEVWVIVALMVRLVRRFR